MKNKRRSAFSPLLTIAAYTIIIVLIALSWVADRQGNSGASLSFMTWAFCSYAVYNIAYYSATRGKVR